MKKILIIDDEELTLQLLTKVLEAQGYQIYLARDGQSGLELFNRTSIDLVITDMVMPVKDGLKTILELREKDAEVPVIAISGGGAIAKERYLAIAGYIENVTTIAKPFSKDEIVATVRELLSGKA